MGLLWIVVDRCGSLWVVVGRCGSLWVVPGFSNYGNVKQLTSNNSETHAIFRQCFVTFCSDSIL